MKEVNFVCILQCDSLVSTVKKQSQLRIWAFEIIIKIRMKRISKENHLRIVFLFLIIWNICLIWFGSTTVSSVSGFIGLCSVLFFCLLFRRTIIRFYSPSFWTLILNPHENPDSNLQLLVRVKKHLLVKNYLSCLIYSIKTETPMRF